MAAHINGCKCFQIELSRGYDYSAFHDDLKKLYEQAGVQNQSTVFLFTDTQVSLTNICSESLSATGLYMTYIVALIDIGTVAVIRLWWRSSWKTSTTC